MIKWKHFPCYWPFVWGIQWSPVNSPRKGQWHGALMFSLIGAWINGWVNNWDAGDLRRCCAHFDITVMYLRHLRVKNWLNIYINFYTCVRKIQHGEGEERHSFIFSLCLFKVIFYRFHWVIYHTACTYCLCLCCITIVYSLQLALVFFFSMFLSFSPYNSQISAHVESLKYLIHL